MPLWPRSPTRFLFAVTVLALSARLMHFTRVDLWQDEANEVFICEGSMKETLDRIRDSEMRPPLRYYFLKLWLLGGRGTHYLRLPSLLFSAAAVGLLYLAARLRFREETARTAAILLAAASFPTSSAHFCRSYGMDTFMAVLAVLTYLRHEDQPSAARGVAYSLAISAAAHTSYFFDFLLALLFASHLAALRRRHLSLDRFLQIYIPAAVLTAPLLLLAPGQWMNARLHEWHARSADAFDLYEYFLVLGSGRILNWDFSAIQGFAAILALFFAGTGSWRILRQAPETVARPESARLFFWWFAGCSGLIFLFSLFSIGLFTIRTMILFAPAYYVLVAAGIQGLQSQAGRFLSLALLAGINVYSFRTTQDLRYLTNGCNKASEFLRATLRPGEWVVHAQHFTYFPMRFYGPEMPHRILQDEVPWNWGAGQVPEEYLLTDLEKARSLPGLWFVHKTLNAYHHYQDDEQNYRAWLGQLMELAAPWETHEAGETREFLSDQRVRIGNVILTHYQARVRPPDAPTPEEKIRRDLQGLREAYPPADEYVARALNRIGPSVLESPTREGTD
ncbi:MAG: glycosyltransferase family 39 protein [Planctomycetes bacterium]|nr:glycosyltransferase family 39 protein [Planctomycetota bacterium]